MRSRGIGAGQGGGNVRGGVPLAAVALVGAAACVLAGTAYYLRSQPDKSVAEEQDLVYRVSKLVQVIKRHVESEKDTLNAMGNRETAVVEGLVQAAPPEKSPLAAEPLTVLKLSGIMWDPERPLAIMNGTVAGVAERVGGYRIVEIRQESVALEDNNGHRHVLQLYE